MGGKLFYPKEKMLKNLTKISILYIIECTKFYVSYYILMENFNEVQEIPDVKETKEGSKTEEFENSTKYAKKQKEQHDKEESKDQKKAEEFLENSLNNIENPEQFYYNTLDKLRNAFPNIPEDLTNKNIWIRYENSNWKILYISIHPNGINITKWNEGFSITKESENVTRSTRKDDDYYVYEKADSNTFNKYIDEIINNKDKCEIKIY